jgi:hypothetical protein
MGCYGQVFRNGFPGGVVVIFQVLVRLWYEKGAVHLKSGMTRN